MGRARGRRDTAPVLVKAERLTAEMERMLKAVDGTPGEGARRAMQRPATQYGRPASQFGMLNVLDAIATGDYPTRGLPRDARNDSPFGPLNPLQIDALDAARPDTGRPGPRITQYPVASNLPGNGQRPISWEVLRAASTSVDILRRCIEVRKRDMRALKWAWVVSDEAVNAAYQADPTRGKSDIAAELREKWQPEINRLTEFWKKPWRSQGLDFGAWINGVMEDYLVLDGVAVYPQTTFGGDLLAMEIIDAATIKPLRDFRGARPVAPYPAYQQILWGFPRGEFMATAEIDENGNEVINGAFLADQLYYHVENYRPFSTYGYSPTEQALIAARLYLNRQGWMFSEYDDGVVPEMVIESSETLPITPHERRVYEDDFNNEMTGQTGARHRAKILFPGMTPTILPSVDERYKPEYDLFLIKWLSSFYGVTAQRLGFSEARGLGGSGMHQQMAANAEDLGTAPDIEILTTIVHTLSDDFMRRPPEVEFQFIDPTKDDQAQKATITVGQINSGQRTVNEARLDDGLPILNFPEADMVFIAGAAGPVFLEGSSAPKPLPGQLGLPGTPSNAGAANLANNAAAVQADQDAPDVDAEDTNKAARAAELKAYRAFAKRGPRGREFAWQWHDVDEVAVITKAGDPDPKAQAGEVPPQPDHRWPAWAVDTALATYVATQLGSKLVAGLAIPSLADAWATHTAHWRAGDPVPNAATWLLSQGVTVERIAQLIGQTLRNATTVAYGVGDRSAQAALSTDLRVASTITVDWSGFRPGDVDAARLLLSADGATEGLTQLLADYDVRIKGIAANRLDELAAALADGLERGEGPATIARALRGAVDDPAWTGMVAWTETNRAQSTAALNRYTAAGTPGKEWFTANDQRVCPICKGNEDASPILIEDAFPSGEDAPPAHPRCRCALLPVRVLVKSARAVATGHEDDAERLHRYWTRGEGLAKWADSPHPFAALREHLAEFIADPKELDATTAQWHHDALGFWPGRDAHKSFDPAEARDAHGQWSAIGAAVRAVEHATGNDRLKLAGKIDLVNEHDRLHSTTKFTGEQGTVRLASIDRGGERVLRIGVGSEDFGRAHTGSRAALPAWTGNPENIESENAHRAALRKERDELEKQYNYATSEHERNALSERIDAIEENALDDVIPDGATTQLDADEAKQLRDGIAKGLQDAKDELKRVNADYDRVDEIEAHLKAGTGDTAALKAEHAELLADLADSYQVVNSGDLHGPWGTLHYQVTIDDPTQGPELAMGVIPHGKTWDEISGDASAVFDGSEAAKLLKQLDAVMA